MIAVFPALLHSKKLLPLSDLKTVASVPAHCLVEEAVKVTGGVSLPDCCRTLHLVVNVIDAFFEIGRSLLTNSVSL